MFDTLWVGHHLRMSVYSTVYGWEGHHLRMSVYGTVYGWEGGEGWRQSGPAAPGTLCAIVF